VCEGGEGNVMEHVGYARGGIVGGLRTITMREPG